jgi:mannitol-1-phosphate 5-dehydrogenase
MTDHVFTGFGFGPIQAGLFVKEAFQSGNFSRLAVAEIDPALVKAVCRNQNKYAINIAGPDGIETTEIEGVELLNPRDRTDRKILQEALCQSTEICTSLPSVNFYTTGNSGVASLIAHGLENSQAPATIIYTAENHNHAAEILAKKIQVKYLFDTYRVQFLNTVIGKMSQVVTNPAEINELNLTPIAPGIDRAFLVEEFNRILVSRTEITDVRPGIEVFIEKENLLPFEEAKLYGHNAIHALIAYLGAIRGYEKMNEAKEDPQIMQIARDAFFQESGAALIQKHQHLNDPLFTPAGYQDFAEDLLHRIMNPYLSDTIERAARDPIRKLGYHDRIFGTMTLALEHNIEPTNMAIAARAGWAYLLQHAQEYKLPPHLCLPGLKDFKRDAISQILPWIWGDAKGKYLSRLITLVENAEPQLELLRKDH